MTRHLPPKRLLYNAKSLHRDDQARRKAQHSTTQGSRDPQGVRSPLSPPSPWPKHASGRQLASRDSTEITRSVDGSTRNSQLGFRQQGSNVTWTQSAVGLKCQNNSSFAEVPYSITAGRSGGDNIIYQQDGQKPLVE